MPYEGSEWYLQSYPSTNDVSQTRRSSLTIKQNMFWAKTFCGTKEVAAFHGEIRRANIVAGVSLQIVGCNQVFALNLRLELQNELYTHTAVFSASRSVHGSYDYGP